MKKLVITGDASSKHWCATVLQLELYRQAGDVFELQSGVDLDVSPQSFLESPKFKAIEAIEDKEERVVRGAQLLWDLHCQQMKEGNINWVDNGDKR